MPANRTASFIAFNTRANLPQAIDRICDEDCDRLGTTGRVGGSGSLATQ